MKKHHLDPIIDKLRKYSSDDTLDISSLNLLLKCFEEIKDLDICLENLSNEINDYDP